LTHNFNFSDQNFGKSKKKKKSVLADHDGKIKNSQFFDSRLERVQKQKQKQKNRGNG
jgi:hypothetical protein